MVLFKNENCSASISEQGDKINFHDLKDTYNQTTGFTRNVRGIKRAVDALKKLSVSPEKEKVTFWQICKILDSFKLNTHTWCAID